MNRILLSATLAAGIALGAIGCTVPAQRTAPIKTTTTAPPVTLGWSSTCVISSGDQVVTAVCKVPR